MKIRKFVFTSGVCHLRQVNLSLFASVPHPQDPSLISLWISFLFRLRSEYLFLLCFCIVRIYSCLLGATLIYLKILIIVTTVQEEEFYCTHSIRTAFQAIVHLAEEPPSWRWLGIHDILQFVDISGKFTAHFWNTGLKFF